MGTHEGENFVIQEKISYVVEKKCEVIDKIKNIPEDHSSVEIVYFVKIDEFFEKENQMIDLVEINYQVNKLIESCGTAKVDAAVSVKKLKENYGDIENLIDKNYDFLVFENFISDMDELNYGVLDEELVRIFEFF